MDNRQDSLQTIVEELLQSFIRTNSPSRVNPSTRNFNPFRRNREPSVNSNPSVPHNTNIDYNSILELLNSNMQQYHNNMSALLDIIQTIIRDRSYVLRRQTPRQHFNSTPYFGNPYIFSNSFENNNAFINPLDQYLYYLISPIDTSNNFPRFNTQNFENTIVHATDSQVTNATDVLTYTDGIVNDSRCPISLEEFEEGEQVIKICHCGHTFGEQPLRNWFLRNVHCPVCRYDIRNYVRHQEEEQEPEPEPLPPTPSQQPIHIPLPFQMGMPLTGNENVDTIAQSIRDNLSAILQNYQQPSLDASQNLIYTFDLPIFSNNR
jgi:hypothetical protein